VLGWSVGVGKSNPWMIPWWTMQAPIYRVEAVIASETALDVTDADADAVPTSVTLLLTLTLTITSLLTVTVASLFSRLDHVTRTFSIAIQVQSRR
jgi:hypothetical protein